MSNVYKLIKKSQIIFKIKPIIPTRSNLLPETTIKV